MSENSMLLKFLIVAFSVVLTCQASKVKEKVKEASLIPLFADGGCNDFAKVVFDTGAEMHLGNILAFTSTLPVPTVTYDFKDKCETVAVIFFGVPTNFFDLDALLGGAFAHWEIVNIPSKVLKEGFNGQSGDELASYVPPIHPTNDHRYTFFVYCQKEYINPKDQTHMDFLLSRTAFQVKDRAKELHLGEPVACNFANLGVVAGGPDLSNIANRK
ncbi:uncharacterized protein LOC129234399 [Uloborus diversus]|uniref:uncharacterized protein LOC129234399 n=1 Tax=Uloborus diversus TaxID=327109 RepID=UPI0024093E30|nr:uncharacterized protein LOC129234399 [Uloborus diversus]